ncbi:MAG: amidohydrolase family protein, partial [Clostridiales bacterium]
QPEVAKIIEEMAKRGTWLVPTLSAFFKEYDRGEVEQNYGEVIKSFRLCHQAGVKIAMGTDAGVPWVGHDKAAIELEHMSLYGMTNMESIIAATLDAARMIGVDGEYGSLEAGKFADFLILKENPLEDIRTVQDIDAVYKLGKLVVL